jgi:hypothetical protein
MKRMLCLVLFFCIVDVGLAMKSKGLMHIDVAEEVAISKLMTGVFDNEKAQACIGSIRSLIAKIEASGDKSGVAILTLDNLYSVVDIVEALVEYRAAPSKEKKDKLLSISDSYGGQVSGLICINLDLI